MQLLRSWFWVVALVLASTPAMAQTAADIQKRVSPGEYRAAPAGVRAALEKAHCELPDTQHWDNAPVNIVSGHFADPAETDWAALCIAPDGSTRAIIFWGKAAPCPAEIRHGWALETRLPRGEAGSLYLRAATAKQILNYRKFFGDPNSNPVTHDGVEVGEEHASLIYYCYEGRWLELQGND